MTVSKRLAPIALAILASVLCLGVRTAAAATKYKVYVDSAPRGATVYVDSKANGAVGVTPWAGTLTKGKHTYILELEGYEDVTKVVTVKRTKKRQDTFLTMIKKPNPPKIDIQASADQNVFGATVFIDGLSVGTAPILVTTTAGRHQVQLKKEGFKDFEMWTEVKDDEKASLTPVLTKIEKAKLGTIIVEADVPDAEVMIDGNPVGRTPVSVKDVIEGLHIVEVTKSPALPWKQTVQVIADQQTKVSAQLKATIGGQGGIIKVISNVKGAHVYLDGIDHGEVPVEIKNVKTGEHIIEVKAAGYITRDEPVTVNDGSSTVLKIDLNPEAKTEARIKVSSPVPNADVFIDGASVGKVPVDVPIAAGEHFVIVSLDGYKNFEATVRVDPGQTQTVPAVLRAIGKLLILSDPPGAQVLINGMPAGETPLDLKELETGDTVVRIEMAGRQPQEKTLKIVGGESQTLSLKLELIGRSDRDLEDEQRGLSSFGARTLPRGRSTIDLGIGYPYLTEIKVNVGAGTAGKYGFDAGVGVRTFFARTELGLGVRFMLVNKDPFTAGAFSDLWWGSKLLDNSKRNGLTFNAGMVASLTALTHVTVSGRLYMNAWSDRHCPSLTADDEFEADSSPLRACEVYRDVRISGMTATGPQMNLIERMEKTTGVSSAAPDAMFERETGARLMASIVAEISFQQRWNVWFMLEGTFNSERALFTDPFAQPMLESDYRTYGRMGLTYKF